MRLLRGISALVALLAVVGGGPAVLLRAGRWPDLSGGLGDILLRPDDGTLLLGLITVLGWAAWLVFTLSVLVESYAAVRAYSDRRRGRPARGGVRLPGLSAPQGLAAGLVLAVSAMLVSTSGAAKAAAEEVAVATAGQAESSGTAAAEPPKALLRAEAVHVVRMGDDLWSIAEKHYGDGRQWTRIAEANRDLIDDPHRIDAGWRLRIPDVLPTPSSTSTVSTRVVEPVETIHRSADSSQPASDAETDSRPGTGGDGDGAPAPTVQDLPAPDPEVIATATIDQHVVGLLGGTVGGLCAATVAAALASRRTAQQASRPLGRQFPAPPAEAASLFAATAQLADVPASQALGPALRAVGEAGEAPLPGLRAAQIEPHRITIEFDGPVTVPSGFDGQGTTVSVGGDALRSLCAQPPQRPNPWGATVTAGLSPHGAMQVIDLEQTPLLSLRGDRPTIDGLLNALVMELAEGEWADGVRVTMVGGDLEFVEALESPAVVHCLDVEAALRMQEAAFAERPPRISGHHRDHRLDPARVEAWGPQVLLLDAPVNSHEAERILALVDRGLSVVTSNTVGEVWQVRAAPEISTLPDGRAVLTQSVPRETRDGIVAALRATRVTHTEPAPWWHGDPRIMPLRGAATDPKESAPVDHTHPTVLMLGPTDLVGARGQRPPRAVRQCIEYAAWLLEHPAATSTQMAAELFVAEGTRRSNMSRLRSWLGVDDAGQPYLPDAYSGRISLHPEVTSDWDLLRLNIIAGVGRTPEAGLVAALQLVRGAALADAAPGQWHWAEEVRIEIAATIRDIGVRLAGLALDRGDLDLARWATARALTAAPEDELLLCARVRTEALAGNTSEVQRLALRLAAHARRLDVDLSEPTVALLQQALEGRVRPRQVVGA